MSETGVRGHHLIYTGKRHQSLSAYIQRSTAESTARPLQAPLDRFHD